MRRSLTPWMERWPRPFGTLGREMETLMDRFFREDGGFWTGTELEKFAPMTNLAETEKGYEVTLDLPGLKPEEVKVELVEGRLIVTGERKEEKEEKGKTYHWVERRHGEFRREVVLPTEVKAEEIEARFTNGVLKVTLPKAETVVPKKIAVSVN